MIPTLLFVAFLFMMMMGVPIGASLGLAGAACVIGNVCIALILA